MKDTAIIIFVLALVGIGFVGTQLSPYYVESQREVKSLQVERAMSSMEPKLLAELAALSDVPGLPFAEKFGNRAEEAYVRLQTLEARADYSDASIRELDTILSELREIQILKRSLLSQYNTLSDEEREIIIGLSK